MALLKVRSLEGLGFVRNLGVKELSVVENQDKRFACDFALMRVFIWIKHNSRTVVFIFSFRELDNLSFCSSKL